MGFLLDILDSLVLAVCLPLSGWRLLHYFQLESYQLPGFFRSLKRNARKALLPGAVMGAALALCVLIGVPDLLVLAVAAAMAAALFLARIRGVCCVHDRGRGLAAAAVPAAGGGGAADCDVRPLRAAD